MSGSPDRGKQGDALTTSCLARSWHCLGRTDEEGVRHPIAGRLNVCPCRAFLREGRPGLGMICMGILLKFLLPHTHKIEEILF